MEQEFVPVQPSAPSTPPEPKPESVSPMKQFLGKFSFFRKIFDMGSWLILFALAPVATLIFLSQNAVPGDFFYPAKRGMENVVLAAASVHPATRIAFRTDLTERRLSEAERLLLAKQDTKGLEELVKDIVRTNNEIAKLDNELEKQRLQKELYASLAEYRQRLEDTKTTLIAQGKIPTTSSPVLPAPTNTPVPLPTNQFGQTVRSTNTPVPRPTSTPRPTISPRATSAPFPDFDDDDEILPTNTPVPIPTSPPGQPPIPTNTPVPRATSTPRPPTPTLQPAPGGSNPGDDVDATIEYLDCLISGRTDCTPPFGIGGNLLSIPNFEQGIIASLQPSLPSPILIFPPDNFTVPLGNISLQWVAVAGANEYFVAVFSNSSVIFPSQQFITYNCGSDLCTVTSSTNLTIMLPETTQFDNEEFSWRVMAINRNNLLRSNSSFRNFRTETIGPGQSPVFSTPTATPRPTATPTPAQTRCTSISFSPSSAPQGTTFDVAVGYTGTPSIIEIWASGPDGTERKMGGDTISGGGVKTMRVSTNATYPLGNHTGFVKFGDSSGNLANQPHDCEGSFTLTQ